MHAPLAIKSRHAARRRLPIRTAYSSFAELLAIAAGYKNWGATKRDVK